LYIGIIYFIKLLIAMGRCDCDCHCGYDCDSRTEQLGVGAGNWELG
jgi:hypothetical protein